MKRRVKVYKKKFVVPSSLLNERDKCINTLDSSCINSVTPLVEKLRYKKIMHGINRKKILYSNLSTEQVDRAFHYAKTSLAIEGQKVPEGVEDVIKKRLRGQISQSNFRRIALEIVARG